MASARKVAGVSAASLAAIAAIISAATPLFNKLIDRLIPPSAPGVETAVTYKPGYGP